MVSNLTITGGFTPGFSTVGTNGTIRWNSSLSMLEYNLGGVWMPMGGGGSGFPLTNHANFAGFNATNVGNVYAGSAALTGLLFVGYGETSQRGAVRWNQSAGDLQYLAVDGNWNNFGMGFPLRSGADFRSNIAYNIRSLQLINSTGTLTYGVSGTYTGLLYAGRPVGAGSGSGFPLTSSVSAAGFDVSSIGTATAARVVAGALGPGTPLAEAFLLYDGTNYTHAYGPRVPLTRTQILQMQTYGNLPVLYPGFTAYVDFGTDAGSSYIITNTLTPANYYPNTTNDFPWPGEPGSGAGFWALLVKHGAAGGSGIMGPAGQNGAGQLFFGPWSPYLTYTNAGGTTVVVRADGQWYELTASSSLGQTPSLFPSVWTVSVARGISGTLTVVSNVVDRGEWNAVDAYTTNDQVTYGGNLFFVSETNLAPPVGYAGVPGVNGDDNGTNSPYWKLRVSRGLRGLQGVAGDVINTYSYHNYYTYFFTNLVGNAGSATNRVLVWVGNTGGTDNYSWVSHVPVGTNILSASNGVLVWNGVVFTSGNTSETLSAVYSFKDAGVDTTATSWDFLLAYPTASVVHISLPVSGAVSGSVIACRKQAGDFEVLLHPVAQYGTVGISRVGTVLDFACDDNTNWWLK